MAIQNTFPRIVKWLNLSLLDDAHDSVTASTAFEPQIDAWSHWRYCGIKAQPTKAPAPAQAPKPKPHTAPKSGSKKVFRESQTLRELMLEYNKGFELRSRRSNLIKQAPATHATPDDFYLIPVDHYDLPGVTGRILRPKSKS